MRPQSLPMGALVASLGASLLMLNPVKTHAKDLGVIGQTFPIAETDILDVLARTLKADKASGKIDALDKAFASRARRSLERPPPVAGLVTTTNPRTWLFDPSIVVQRDIADQNGRVFARAGDRINPLLSMPDFNRAYVFIDGDDPRQVTMALKARQAYGPVRTRLVLVNGSPIDLMRQLKVELYFDQQGMMTERFGLMHVPATVVREGDRLRISELLP